MVNSKYPNVIVIMLDSLRPDFLGCYGNKEVKSQTIDKIASEGVTFTRAYAEYPITIPSRTAFLCGIYTHTNRPWMKPRNEDPKLPEFIKGKGYQTAAIGDTALTWGHLVDLGFDYFNASRFGKCAVPKNPERFVDLSNAYFPPECTEREHNIYKNTVLSQKEGLESIGSKSPEVITNEAINYINRNREKPFFLWIDYFEPHEPWEAPPEYLNLYDLNPKGRFIPMPPAGANFLSREELHNILIHYMATITQIDTEIARIEEHLERLNLKKNTLMVITSDHGEPFGEHGIIRKYGVPLYEELSRIVLIMRKPELIPPGKRNNALVSNVDLPITITSMLNIPIPDKFEGKNLQPLFSEEKESVRNETFIGAYNLHAGVVTKRWKFIDNKGEKENEIYYLKEDPTETLNLIDEKKNLSKELHLRIWQFNRNWSSSLAWRDHPIKRKPEPKSS